MNNLSLVEETYQKLSTEELIRIAADPASLEPDVIPVLQKELIARSHPEEALALTEYLLNGTGRLSFLSLEELQNLVYERIESGEPIESIKLDLKDNGINILDIITAESRHKERAFDYMLSLKEQGLHEIEVKERIQDTLSLDENESEVLHAQFRKRGWENMIIGLALVGLVALVFILSLAGQMVIRFGAALVFAAGVSRIVIGSRQLKA